MRFYNLVRFYYILEQQHQSDSNEIRTKTRENLLEYFDQFRSFDDDLEEDNNDQSSDESQESTPITSPNPVRIFEFGYLNFESEAKVKIYSQYSSSSGTQTSIRVRKF